MGIFHLFIDFLNGILYLVLNNFDVSLIRISFFSCNLMDVCYLRLFISDLSDGLGYILPCHSLCSRPYVTTSSPGYIPSNIQEALACFDSAAWTSAISKELDAHKVLWRWLLRLISTFIKWMLPLHSWMRRFICTLPLALLLVVQKCVILIKVLMT